MQSKFYQPLLTLCLLGVAIWYITNLQPTTSSNNRINIDQEEAEKENPTARMEAEFKMLKNPATGKIPRGIQQRAVNTALKTPAFQLPKHPNQKTLPNITVTERGPNNYGGRTRAFAFDVRNSNIMIAGGVSSGIFRSTDNGSNWTRVTPAGMIHNLTAIAQDTRAGQQDTWYVGTGEKNGNSAEAEGATYLGFGIWKSTDNGLTWAPLASTQNNDLESFDDDFDFISRIIVNPNNGDILVVTGEVLKRSSDNGANWIDELGNSLANEGNNGDIIYNAASSRFYVALHGQASQDAGVWSSPDGDNWTQVRTPTQLNANGVGRMVLANVANTPGIVVMSQLSTAFSCTGGSSEAGLHHFDGTSTWTDHTDKISDCAGGSTSPKGISLQGAYNMCITTKPNDANLVYFGGVEIFRYNLSTNAYDFIGGSQLAANATNLHVDNHLLMFEDNTTLWAGNDGGIRSTNAEGTLNSAGFVWSNKNTDYVTYQYYDGDIHPTSGSNFLAGAAQDNAFTIQPTNAQALEVGPTADGIAVGILSGTSFTSFALIAGFQGGGLVYVDNSDEFDIQPDGKSQGFITKFHLDDDNREFLYYPDNSPGLLRTRNASFVETTISSDASTDWEDLTGVSGAIAQPISALDASRNLQYGGAYFASDANRKLYFGTEDGKVYRLANPAFIAAGTAPTEITPTGMGGNGFVSDISVNPMDDKEILVTYSNYGVASVWHTSDASVASPTWTNVEGAAGTAVELASTRSAMIVKLPSTTVYLVGTSAGLYATDMLNGATTSWTKIGTNNDIGVAVCSDMRLRTSDNKMMLSTHGNGLFLLDFANTSSLSVDWTAFDGKAVKDGNQLAWKTAIEQYNVGFEIQQSQDGEAFEKIGFVEGAGFSYETRSYQFLDRNTDAGTTFYRLKQIDESGSYKYSAVISVVRAAEKEEAFNVYPNPVVDYLTIENGAGMATVYNIAGQPLLEVQINSAQQQINVANLPQGNYVLTIRESNGQLRTQQFVK